MYEHVHLKVSFHSFFSVGDEIVCPRCRKVAYLGDRGVDGLPRNVDLNYAVEVIKPMLAPSPIIPGGPELGSQCKKMVIRGGVRVEG